MQALLQALGAQAFGSSERAVVVSCAKGKIRYLNQAAQRLFSVHCRSHSPLNWSSIFPPADGRKIAELECLLLAGQSSSHPERELEFKNNEAGGPLVVSGRCIFDEGCVLGIIWEFYQPNNGDSEWQLRQQRYHKVFKTSAIAQWVLDIEALYQLLHQQALKEYNALVAYCENQPDFLEQIRETIRVVDVNQAAADLYGVETPDEWCTQIVARLQASDILECARLACSVDGGGVHQAYQWSTLTFEGEALQLWISAEIPGIESLHYGILVSALDITMLKKTELELEERQQFLETILRTIPDLLFVYDFDQQEHVFSNEDIGLRLGYTKEQLQEAGTKFLTYIIHPEDRITRDALNGIRQALLEDKICESTLRLQDSEGEWRYFYFRSAALDFNLQGEVAYCVVVARDITEVLKTQRSLNVQERRNRLLAENFSDVILTTDADLIVDYVSPSLSGLLGFTPEEFLALHNPQRFIAIGLEGHLNTLMEDYSSTLHQCRGLSYVGEDYQRVIESEIQHLKGHRLPVELKISLLLGDYREVQGLLIVCRDIGERRQVEADLRLAAKVFENGLEGIYITDTEGLITQVNRAFTGITGYKAADSVGRRPAFLSSGWHEQYFVTEIKPVLELSGYWQGELINRRVSGEVFPAWVGITEVRAKSGELLGLITSFRDITEAKSSEQRIRKLAYFDALTELPNRSLFYDRLNQELARAERTGTHVALLFLDLDGFKAINDSMGHAVGDRLLAETARRLKDCIRSDDTVARMGGDEFTIILSELTDRSSAESAAAQISLKVKGALSEPCLLHDREVIIGTSIGIAVYPQDGEESAELLKNADTAMYHAKAMGKNGYQFYTDAMNASSLERLASQNSLYQAIINEHLELFYQPIYDFNQQRIICFEALIRWNHPSKGIIAPEQFMPLAEEAGFGIKIGDWVLKQACQQMAGWLSMGTAVERISVNISGMHFTEGNLSKAVKAALDDSGIEAQHLQLEFSEALLMEDVAYTQALLQELKALGVQIAVDDFGTGFSSLHYLKQMPVDSLKIDRRFIAKLPQVAEDSCITQAIIALAQSFELEVIAEGIENLAQLDYLRSLGCERGQGYLFGRPQGAHKVTSTLVH